MPLEFLHSGCILKDDSKTIIVNRHLHAATATHQYRTDSKKRGGGVQTKFNGILDPKAQLSLVIFSSMLRSNIRREERESGVNLSVKLDNAS